MTKYFFDAYAIIKMLIGEFSYDKFQNVPVATNSLHLAEVYYFFLRTKGQKVADDRLKQVNPVLYEITQSIALNAALFRWKEKSKGFSYADCIGYLTAKKHQFKFVTGDFPFKGMPDVEFFK